MKLRLAAVLLGGLALGLLAPPEPAEAFCGFYVAGADASLYNDATVVVLMRDGTRTVLSMQNDYQGPPEDFALVIPVPVILREGDVKTLPNPLFERVDRLAAPRLVEYWEEDPCEVRKRRERWAKQKQDKLEAARGSSGVTVEAEFVVGEYNIQLLSAKDATGLDKWLRKQKYNIPKGAESLLRPYVQSGMKFFVAKVDAQKVLFQNGRAMLSPLRFHYDSPDFSLPVRLGLINAQGPQDLLIHILATERYQVANYPNVMIPTNLVVREHTRDEFGKFYVSLFDKTLADNPGAVVTEYAWQANGCDPCPSPPLVLADLRALGADVLPRFADAFAAEDDSGDVDFGPLGPSPVGELAWTLPREFVLTRLHARYDAQTLGEDLVFEAAPNVQGGIGMPDPNGRLGTGFVHHHSANRFQARYAILHRWAESVHCADAERGQWGERGWDTRPSVARNLAFQARDAELEDFLAVDFLRADVAAPLTVEPADQPQEPPAGPREPPKSCSCTTDATSAGVALTGIGLLSLLGLRRHTRKRLRS